MMAIFPHSRKAVVLLIAFAAWGVCAAAGQSPPFAAPNDRWPSTPELPARACRRGYGDSAAEPWSASPVASLTQATSRAAADSAQGPAVPLTTALPAWYVAARTESHSPRPTGGPSAPAPLAFVIQPRCCPPPLAVAPPPRFGFVFVHDCRKK